MTPTQRTLKYYRDAGFTCAVTEKWNPYAKIRQDLFGFIDLVALIPGRIVGIQTTSGSNHAARREKIRGLPEARKWLETGAEIHIASWAKKKPRGQKRALWALRIEEITLSGEGQVLI